MKNDKHDVGDWGLTGSPLVQLFWHALLLSLTIIALLPIIWMVSTAFKPSREIFAAGLRLLPSTFTTDHFVRLWQGFPIPRIMLNTLVVAVTITFSQLLTSVLAAYGFARYRFPLRSALFYLCLATMFIPIQVVMVSNYLLISSLGLLNNLLGVLAPQIASGFGIFLLRQHLIVFPQSLLDAAQIDGAGELTVLVRIVLPVIRPVLFALGILLFINSWNQYVWPTLILSNPENMTLPIWLRQFMHAEAGMDWGLLMAASFLGVIPALTMYALAHRQIMGTFASTGLKG